MQTTQNYPNNKHSPPTENNKTDTHIQTTIDPRIPEIIKARAKGLTWENTARHVDLTRKAVYDIRQRPEYMTYLIDYLFPKTQQILNDILEDPNASDYKQMRAIDEVNKMIRAVLPKQVESRSLEIQARIQLNESRVSTGDLLEKVRGRGDGLYEALKEILLESE